MAVKLFYVNSNRAIVISFHRLTGGYVDRANAFKRVQAAVGAINRPVIESLN